MNYENQLVWSHAHVVIGLIVTAKLLPFYMTCIIEEVMQLAWYGDMLTVSDKTFRYILDAINS